MLIRSEQLDLLNQACQRNFEERVCSFVREKMPSTTADLSKGQIREFVLSHISAAREFGLKSQSSIVQFVCLAFLPGPSFYKNRYLAAFLRRQEFDPNAKMQCIVDQLTDQIARLTKASTL